MKLPHRRTLFTVLTYAAAGLMFVTWIGVYLHWRSDSVTYHFGKLGVFRQIPPPKSFPKNAIVIFEPLAEVDGWINGEDVRFDPLFVRNPPGKVGIKVPEVSDLSPLLELPAGNPGLSE